MIREVGSVQLSLCRDFLNEPQLFDNQKDALHPWHVFLRAYGTFSPNDKVPRLCALSLVTSRNGSLLILGERLLLQAIPLNHPYLLTQLEPFVAKSTQNLVDIQSVLAHYCLILLICAESGNLPLSRPPLHGRTSSVALTLNIHSNHVEAGFVLVLLTWLEQLDLRELAKSVEQGERIPGFWFMQEHNHPPTFLDARDGQRQLRGLQTVCLAQLTMGAKEGLVRAQHTPFSSDEIKRGRRADQSREEVSRVRVVGGDLVGQHAHVASHQRDVGRMEGEALVFDEDGDAAELVAERDARRLRGRVELEGLLHEATWRETKGQDRGPRTGRQGEYAGGRLHLVGDAAHHAHEFLARFAVGIVGVPFLLFEVLVALRAVPALYLCSKSAIILDTVEKYSSAGSQGAVRLI